MEYALITEYELSKILYETDPMHTGCNVNVGMRDEYDSEARHLVHLLGMGVPFPTALHDVFSFFFQEGCLIGLKETEIIVDQYYAAITRIK